MELTPWAMNKVHGPFPFSWSREERLPCAVRSFSFEKHQNHTFAKLGLKKKKHFLPVALLLELRCLIIYYLFKNCILICDTHFSNCKNPGGRTYECLKYAI